MAPEATRRSVSSVALISRRDTPGGRTLWLARWNARWNALHFVAGHLEEGESFRECVLREIREELGLGPADQVTVSDEPLAVARFSAWSRSAQERTAYVMALFRVELSDEARRRVDADPLTCWLTAEQIRARRSADGRPVSATMGRLLREAGMR
jgi:8-oxo-dGTP pyrophosphatase MutT (NUDIX family)